MLILGQKGANLDQNGPKMGGTRFFWNFHLVISSIDPKCSLDMQNQEDPITRFREIGQKVHFWAKKGIFGPKLAQNGQNRIFRAKSENVTSVALGSPNFVPNFRKFL